MYKKKLANKTPANRILPKFLRKYKYNFLEQSNTSANYWPDRNGKKLRGKRGPLRYKALLGCQKCQKPKMPNKTKQKNISALYKMPEWKEKLCSSRH